MVLLASRAFAKPWQPTEGHMQVPLWSGSAPNSIAGSGPEDEVTPRSNLVAGKPWLEVANVVRPTMTIYKPAKDEPGPAVVVFPGGGYTVLAIDLEGTEVCDWLTSRGITCVLLKYRVPGSGLYPKAAPWPKSGPFPKSPFALADAQRAIGLVRFRAREWGIDPHKIGVLGFSAGGHLVAATSTHFAKRVYSPVDGADAVSCRPDFAVALYPGHLSFKPKIHELSPDIRVTRETPPTFLLQAEDDPVDRVENALVYYAALRAAGVPAELHLYAHGGHAFGLRRTDEPITTWPALVERWLRAIAVLSPPP